MSSGVVTSIVRSLRIVSPLTRAREHATIEDVQALDIVEITDLPVYAVDPLTYQSTKKLQRFIVGDGLSLKPFRG